MQEHKELTRPRTALTYKPCVLILILMTISRPSSLTHKLFMFMLWSNGDRKKRGARERHERGEGAPAREPSENRLLPLPSRVSFARPVLSCAHYFQAPATQAARETREESASACPRGPWKSFTPSPLACLFRARRSFLCPLPPSACYVCCLGLCLRYAFSYGNAYAYACACVASEDRALQAKAANKFFIIIEMLVLTSLKLKGPNLSLSLFP